MASMTPLLRLQNLLSGKPVDRPPFFPALYDYKAGLAGVPPHLFGQKEDEIIRALSVEAEELRAEALTCAYDIYNVEAEALGAKVLRRQGLPMPEIEKPLSQLRFLTDGDTIFVLTRDRKKIIDTLKSGQLVFSLALGEIVEDLKGEITALQKERKYSVTAKGKKYPVILHPDT